MKTPLPMPPPTALLFTEAQSQRASAEWKASCGPHSIAAACGLTLDQVKAVLPEFQGWMAPTLMEQTLLCLGQEFQLTKLAASEKSIILCEGINRIQWEGPWLKPGVPVRAAYRHTHWVACSQGMVLCTACLPATWITWEEWVSFHFEEAPTSPFYVTHHYRLSRLLGL